MTSKNEIAKKEAALPATTYNYGDDAGAGFEGTSSADLSIPFLSIIQSNSPQVEDEVEGAKPGLLFNTVTQEFSDSLNIIPVHKEHAYVEWIPRDSGGGFVGMHEVGSEIVKQALAANAGNRGAKLILANGHELIETHYIYGLCLDEAGKETTGFGVLSFTSTKIKPVRDWLTSMYTIKGRPPIFANRAKVSTVKQKNAKGTFYNFQITPLKENNWMKSLIDPATEGHLIEEARAFREMVTTGKAKAAFNTQDAAGADADSDSDAAPF